MEIDGIKIDRGIPLPSIKWSRRDSHKNIARHVAVLKGYGQEGDSVFIKDELAANVSRTIAGYYGSSIYAGLTVRSVEGGTRVWKVRER